LAVVVVVVVVVVVLVVVVGFVGRVFRRRARKREEWICFSDVGAMDKVRRRIDSSSS